MIGRVNAGLRPVPGWVLYPLGALPVLWLFWQAAAGRLGVDPVKALEHELGLIGLQLIVAVLAVSPLRRLTGLNLMRFRRALGVLAFCYVALHFLVWLVLDMQFFWGQIAGDLVKRPFILVGFLSLLLLAPLAATSNDWSVRRLGARAWRRLHWLTYPAAILAGVHFLWLVKTWPVEPLTYLGLILGLLALRIWLRRR